MVEVPEHVICVAIIGLNHNCRCDVVIDGRSLDAILSYSPVISLSPFRLRDVIVSLAVWTFDVVHDPESHAPCLFRLQYTCASSSRLCLPVLALVFLISAMVLVR